MRELRWGAVPRGAAVALSIRRAVMAAAAADCKYKRRGSCLYAQGCQNASRASLNASRVEVRGHQSLGAPRLI